MSVTFPGVAPVRFASNYEGKAGQVAARIRRELRQAGFTPDQVFILEPTQRRTYVAVAVRAPLSHTAVADSLQQRLGDGFEREIPSLDTFYEFDGVQVRIKRDTQFQPE